MAFRETQYPDVLEDENGQMWPLDPVTITQLRNNGQVRALPGGGGGGGGMPGVSQGDIAGLGNMLRQQDNSDIVASVQAKMNPGVHQGPSPMAPPGQGGGLPPIGPAAAPKPRMGDEWRGFQNEPPAGATPSGPPISLQRVAPRQRQPQQAPGISPVYQRVGATPEKWVPTQRQTSGISEEQQADIQNRVLESTNAAMDAQAAAAREQEAIFTDRAERLKEKALNTAMRASVVQSDLDKKNSWIQAQQEQVQRRMKEVREMKVDSNQVFEGADGAVSGLLAVFASALGGYSAGINGGPNVAAQMIGNMIDRNIEEQRANIANAQQDAGEERDYFERYVARSADEEKSLAKALELEKMQIAADQILNDESLRMVWPVAKQAKADMQAQQAQALLTVNQAISRTAGERFQPARAGGVIDITDRVLEQQAKRTGLQKQISENQQAITGGGPADKDAVMIDGEVIGKTPEAKEINAQLRSYQTLKQNAQIAEQMIRDGSFLDDDRYSALVNEAMYDLAGSKGSSIRSDTDVQQFGDMLGGVNRAKIRKENQIKIWKDAVRRGGNTLRTRLRQLGLPQDAIEPDETLASE